MNGQVTVEELNVPSGAAATVHLSQRSWSANGRISHPHCRHSLLSRAYDNQRAATTISGVAAERDWDQFHTS